MEERETRRHGVGTLPGSDDQMESRESVHTRQNFRNGHRRAAFRNAIAERRLRQKVISSDDQVEGKGEAGLCLQHSQLLYCSKQSCREKLR